MNLWNYECHGYDKDRVVEDGNRFLTANGYMGVRGTVEEAGKEAFAAVNLAGVYDRFEEKWREPVNAPTPLFCRLAFNGEPMALGEKEPLDHTIGVDYRNGVFYRKTDFGPVEIETRRFVSMADAHLMAMECRYTFREAGEAELRCGIDADVWDINGPHFKYSVENDLSLGWAGVTGEKNTMVCVSTRCGRNFEAETKREKTGRGVFECLKFSAETGRTYTFTMYGAVFTDLDPMEEFELPSDWACTTAVKAAEAGFYACLAQHQAAWQSIWEMCGVTLEGCDEAARGVIASQYQLNSIAPRHSRSMSIPARGLSGQTYKGAIFWDTEVFLFPMFVYTQPEIARSFLMYRISTLEGALKKAKEYGYRGAFYAWESQEGGEEGCTNFNVVDVFTHRPVRTYFRDKQIHISADVAYTMRQYYEITGDRTLLERGGARVLLECARFYLSRASAHLDGKTVDYADVIGPDEYHERVTNNAFTNELVRYTMESALLLEDIFRDRPEFLQALLEELDYEKDWSLLKTVPGRISPQKEKNGVIEQFDGYFNLEDCGLAAVRSRLVNPREYWGGDHGVAGTTQVIKQADVIAMMAMLPERFTVEQMEKNWAYYEPRTEHGSSLSACMYALTACRIGKPDLAWELFMKTACIDVTGVSKQWAGEIYIGGTHPASNGGAWMIAVLGFAGMQLENGTLTFRPRLPEQIQKLTFPVTFRGERFRVEVTKEGWRRLPF